MPRPYFSAFAPPIAWLLALGLSAFGATPKPAPATASSAAAKTASSPSVFDTAAIHGAYSDGDFEKVTSTLEPILAAKTVLPKSDSIFLYRHLGVIYAKDPGTREKGKYCFRKLLDVDPQAQILDLYATDEIYQVFRTVQAEWALSHPHAQGPSVASQGAVAAPAPALEPAASPAAKPARPPQTWKRYAAVGGAVAVTAGLTTWYLLSSQKDDAKKVTLEVDPGQSK